MHRICLYKFMYQLRTGVFMKITYTLKKRKNKRQRIFRSLRSKIYIRMTRCEFCKRSMVLTMAHSKDRWCIDKHQHKKKEDSIFCILHEAKINYSSFFWSIESIKSYESLIPWQKNIFFIVCPAFLHWIRSILHHIPQRFFSLRVPNLGF